MKCSVGFFVWFGDGGIGCSYLFGYFRIYISIVNFILISIRYWSGLVNCCIDEFRVNVVLYFFYWYCLNVIF